jgi:magnesium-transporting ATPase (P-type)
MPDALRAILFMVIITTAIFGWSADQLKRIGSTDGDVIIAYLTALTIAVPPGLVACLSIATSISVVRLTKMKISISDTSKLNAAGYVSVACFDKTGTLTDENILYQGRTLFENGVANDGPRQQEIATQVMATCHSLSVLDGKLVGDQLEVELLRASGWSIISPMDSKYLLATAPNQGSVGKPHTILRHFEFSPDKLRAGTVLVNADGKSIFLLKGSPETIIGLCAPGSVPPNIQNEIAHLTHKGYRVIGIAFREVFPTDDYAAAAPQSELESADLKFLGLIYFSNKLKPDTWPATITSLQNADIQVNMITGDHISTAIAISTECHILPVKRQLYIVDADSSGALLIVNDNTNSNETRSLAQILDEYEKESRSETPVRLAVTGQALLALEKEVDSALFLRLLKSACVFARTKPFQKKQIVTELKHPETPDGPMTYVLFCGDGANDMEVLQFHIL